MLRAVSGKKLAVGALALGLGAILTITAYVASAEDGARACGATGSLPVAQLVERAEPCVVPDAAFNGPDGARMTLADFRGKAVLVNLWATWCPPCVREMPALDRLQAAMGGPGFEVVAISQDAKGAPVAGKFLMDQGLENLALYVDPMGNVARAFKVNGLPATVLLDAEGREIARYMGEAEWDSAEMQEKIAALIGAGEG